jgi:hypothetical protein
MQESGPKGELIVRAAREYRAFHEVLHGLNEDHMAEVWLGTWSIREIVAHMVGWHREMTPALERLARGERPVAPGVSYDDVDAWNARFAAEAKGREITDLLLDLDRTHEDFMQAADRVPAERYEPGKTAYRIVDGNSAHHYHEHGEQIREWRASRGI